MRLRDALNLFLGEYEKASTRRAYNADLQPFVAELGPGRELAQVTPAEVHLYVQDLHQQAWADHTLHKRIKSIKRFFNWLIDIGELEKSPARNIKQVNLRTAIPKSKAATDEEIAEMLKVSYGNPRNHALIRFLVDTGCRAGGAASLRIDDLDLDHLTARVTEKGNKSRPVWFSSETALHLRIWIAQAPLGSEFVFCSADASGMTAASISQIVRRTCIKAGITSRGAHSLRHAMGHKLADQGESVTVAATVLGHNDPQITMQYYYPRDYERAEQAVRKTHQNDEPHERKIVPLFKQK